MLYQILGAIHFLLCVWAIYNILLSKEENLKKLIWAVLVVVFPVAGFIAWYLIGPKK